MQGPAYAKKVLRQHPEWQSTKEKAAFAQQALKEQEVEELKDIALEVASIVLWGQALKGAMGAGKAIHSLYKWIVRPKMTVEKPAPTLATIIEPKIAQQMEKRGWAPKDIELTIANPSRKVATRDNRFDPSTGKRLDEPATGYIAKDGSYIVKNDRTGKIVQISDRNDPNWKAPWSK
jgi:hypothetical protein